MNAPISVVTELAFFDGPIVASLIELACHDAACAPPPAGTGGSLPGKRISSRSPSAVGAKADIQGLTTTWSQIPADQRMAMADKMVTDIVGFKDIDRKDFGSDDEFISAVTDRIADNVANTFSHLTPDQVASFREWYPAANKLAHQWADQYGLEAHQVAGMLASLSPGAVWDHNVEQARLIVETVSTYTNKKIPADKIERLNELITKMNGKAGVAQEKKAAVAKTEAEKATTLRDLAVAGKSDEAGAILKEMAGKKEASGDNLASRKLIESGRAAEALAFVDRLNAAKTPAEKREIRKEANEALGADLLGQAISLDKLVGTKLAAAERSAATDSKVIPLLDTSKSYKLKDFPDDLAGLAVRAIAGEGLPVPAMRVTSDAEPVFDGILRTQTGDPAKIRWQTAGFLGDAVSIMRNGSIENIHRALGTKHKVRNFYNNIVDPSDTEALTADSHATGIAIGMPVGLSHTYVSTNKQDNGKPAVNLLGKPAFASTGLFGAYALIQEGYSQALKKVNRKLPKGTRPLILRELQSTTWEAWRRDYPAKTRANKGDKLGAVGRIQEILDKRDRGTVSFNEANQQIESIRQELYSDKVTDEE